MQDPMAVLEQNYITIQDQVNMLSLSCNQAERDTLNAQLVAARSAYWSCVNKAFHDDDPQVAALTAQLKQQTFSVRTHKGLDHCGRVVASYGLRSDHVP